MWTITLWSIRKELADKQIHLQLNLWRGSLFIEPERWKVIKQPTGTVTVNVQSLITYIPERSLLILPDRIVSLALAFRGLFFSNFHYECFPIKQGFETLSPHKRYVGKFIQINTVCLQVYTCTCLMKFGNQITIWSFILLCCKTMLSCWAKRLVLRFQSKL